MSKQQPGGWSRRQVLAGAAAVVAAPRSWAFGEHTKIDVAELDLGTGTLSRPKAWERMLFEVTETTSVECVTRAVQVKPEDPELFEHPFCVLLGDGPFEPLSEQGIEQLAQFLAYGGFLFIDDTASDTGDGFDACVRRLVGRLFPTRPLSTLPFDHSIGRAFFLLQRWPGRLDRHPFLEGVTVGNLAPLMYGRNDLSGALLRGNDGRHRYACVPGGEAQRREAVKVGINLIMYALTANYKNDQAHVRQLMLERRLK